MTFLQSSDWEVRSTQAKKDTIWCLFCLCCLMLSCDVPYSIAGSSTEDTSVAKSSPYSSCIESSGMLSRDEGRLRHIISLKSTV